MATVRHLVLLASAATLSVAVAVGPAAAAAPLLPVRAFLGQRYALPPLGERRLAPPVLAPFNASTLDPSGGPTAGAFGSKCLQPSGGDEDCLFANIYAPEHALPDGAGGAGVAPLLPILLWIHGGGWTAGTGNSYNGSVLAGGQDIIVITINYRLGGLGFFASEESTKVPTTHGSTGALPRSFNLLARLETLTAHFELEVHRL